MVLITAELWAAPTDWGQRKARNITPGNHSHLGKLGWRHVLPMIRLGNGSLLNGTRSLSRPILTNVPWNIHEIRLSDELETCILEITAAICQDSWVNPQHTRKNRLICWSVGRHTFLFILQHDYHIEVDWQTSVIWVITSSNGGLPPVRCQATVRASDGLLSFGPSRQVSM